MTIELFLIGLTICSLSTGLVVEAIKKMLNSSHINYNSNIIAAICSIIVATIVTTVYAINAHIIINVIYVTNSIVLVILSWLCSMVGYDKVVQTIKQIVSKKS